MISGLRATSDKAKALLIDFDNGAILPPGKPKAKHVPATPVPAVARELACRTVSSFFAWLLRV